MKSSEEPRIHHILSLGAGVQSSTMLLMAVHGEIEPKPELAIFADTGWEPKRVYQWLDWLTEKAEAAGIPVLRVSHGNIRDDTLSGQRFASMPFHIRNKQGGYGLLRRQCTHEYKIKPITRAIRKYLGYKPGQRIKDDHVIQWRGISVDEIWRAKPSRDRWITVRYPLIKKRMTRADCLAWMEKHGYPRPPKSSCIGCPYHDDSYWRELRQTSPGEFAEAVEFDRRIRRMTRIDGEAYLHRSLRPLAEVDFRSAAELGQVELDLFVNECEGMCGV